MPGEAQNVHAKLVLVCWASTFHNEKSMLLVLLVQNNKGHRADLDLTHSLEPSPSEAGLDLLLLS